MSASPHRRGDRRFARQVFQETHHQQLELQTSHRPRIEPRTARGLDGGGAGVSLRRDVCRRIDGAWPGLLVRVHRLPGRKDLHERLEQTGLRGAFSVAAEQDDALGDERLFAVGEFRCDEVERVGARVGEGLDFLPAHVGLGVADLRDFRGLALAIEFARACAALGERDLALRETLGFRRLRGAAVGGDFHLDGRVGPSQKFRNHALISSCVITS